MTPGAHLKELNQSRLICERLHWLGIKSPVYFSAVIKPSEMRHLISLELVVLVTNPTTSSELFSDHVSWACELSVKYEAWVLFRGSPDTEKARVDALMDGGSWLRVEAEQIASCAFQAPAWPLTVTKCCYSSFSPVHAVWYMSQLGWHFHLRSLALPRDSGSCTHLTPMGNLG